MPITRFIAATALAVGAPAAAYGGVSLTGSSSDDPVAAVQSDDDAASATAFVECMRGHGLSDFPDVTIVDGRLVADYDGTGIDPFSDGYRDALAACQSELPAGVEIPGDPEPPTAPPTPEDGDMPPAAPEVPTVPAAPS